MSQELEKAIKGNDMAANTVFSNVVDALIALGISYRLFEHEPVYTMEEANEVCGNLPEQGVKVLFAKIYKTKSDFNFCLIVWTGNKKVDFGQIEKLFGAKKVKLASPEEVKSQLGIEIGALSPFGYNFDYPVVLDKDLLNQSDLFINPGLHDKTIGLRASDLQTIVTSSATVLHLL